jgi:squalene-hopene/tetraprenyl-beta-curcumene cyclase
VRPGGWAFQYNNDHYPDLDDTAVVVMAMDQAQRRGDGGARRGDRARPRMGVGLQSKDGGWGAFDADNAYYYLNNIPFADHGALLDPPTADVTARCVSMLAQLGHPEDKPAIDAARLAGARPARRGQLVRPLGGQLHLRHLVGAVRAQRRGRAARGADGAPRAVGWLEAIQNADGGWGESCDSYALAARGMSPPPRSPRRRLGLARADGGGRGRSATRSRAASPGSSGASGSDGLWGQEHYTGGGFPRVFYLRYHGYPKYFPLWALARYRNLKRGNLRRPTEGM